MWTTHQIARLGLIWINLWFTVLPVINGHSRPVRQTQGNRPSSQRISNLEATLIEERLKITSMQNQLTDLKSRLDAMSSGTTVQPQHYDDEYIKGYVAEIMTNNLDSIQNGLIGEKYQRLRLEEMALEIKDIVTKQIAKNDYGRLKIKTDALANRVRILEQRCSSSTQKNENCFDAEKPNIGKNTPEVNKSSVRYSGQPINHNDTRIAKDCRHVQQLGYTQLGVYRLNLHNGNPILILCKYSKMVVQERKYGRIPFSKTWNEYKYGFGELGSDFWIGNDILWHAINGSSSQPTLTILIYYPGNKRPWKVALYNVEMTKEQERYMLNYSHYRADSNFIFQDQIPGKGFVFMTKDRQQKSSRCPVVNGGWWYQVPPGCTARYNNSNSRFTTITDPTNRRKYNGFLSGSNQKMTVYRTQIWLDFRNRN